MDKVVSIRDVRTFETRGGNQRYVVRDEDGDEYTTFREGIGQAARAFEGRRVRIEYHEEQRGQYTNVYLDKVEPGLVGESEPHEAVPPHELYEKLKPFKEKVAQDIEDDARQTD